MLSSTSFNWEHGRWSSGEKPTATLCVAGDWAPIREFKSIIETNPASLYGDLLPIIQGADLSIVNLEAPLSDQGTCVCKSGAGFKGETRHVSGLTALPFDAVTLANNHVFDFGPDAFQETLDTLKKNNIQWTGAGMSIEEAAKPLILTANGLKIAIVNFSEGEDLTAAGRGPGVMGWEIPWLEAQIQALKQAVDKVIVIAHCGLEYIPFAPPYVMDAFEKMAEAGADAVIGHHPHVPQGIKFHHGVPICCSLGNFVFYQETDLYFRKLGYVVQLGITREALVSLTLLPYQIQDQGLGLLKDKTRDHFFTRFKEISLPLDTLEGITDAWNGFLQYYGSTGFKNEVAMIMEKMETDPQKAAAMFRNRLTTHQHFHHWQDLLTRMVKGELETAPAWAQKIAQEWLTRKIEKEPKGTMPPNKTTILVTDSGLGGLSVFADIANQLREKAPFEEIKLVYFNAWPFPDKGYNHFPDMAAKAIVFNNALEAMTKYSPDSILIACNTLSVIYPFTDFSQTTRSLVTGIVDHGINLVYEHLIQTPGSRVVIFGTPTTTGEETHKKALVKMGISPERIINQGCINLAGKIERDPYGQEVAQMIEANGKQAASKLGPVKETVFAALCCTHFGYCSDLFSTCLARHTGQKVFSLNPNTRMGQLDQVWPRRDLEKMAPQFPFPKIEMKIVSRVEWEETRITAYERLLKDISPQTVKALKQYTWNKDLFQVD